MGNEISIENFNAIKHNDNKELTVIWDLGRRCTYDCSYCSPHYHTDFSPLMTKEKFMTTADSIIRYADMLNEYRKQPIKTSLAFTGGEPTLHPGFFEWLEELREKYPYDKRTKLGLQLNVTTNGCYNKKRVLQLIKTVNSVTISYHAEATAEQKKLVLDNIETCKEHGFNFKVNLMMHKDYFEECTQLADYFKQENIKFVPRIIGDGVADKESKTTQVYSKEQLNWFRQYWEDKNQVTKKDCGSCSTTNTSLGRPCCRQDQLQLKFGDTWQPGTFAPSTNFNQWHCTVNWFFFYVCSEFDYFGYHQTCEVNFNNKIGKNGKASEIDLFTDKIRTRLEEGTMPVLKCPKMNCGCGLCASKALHKEDLEKVIQEDYNFVPNFIEEKVEKKGAELWQTLDRMESRYGGVLK